MRVADTGWIFIGDIYVHIAKVDQCCKVSLPPPKLSPGEGCTGDTCNGPGSNTKRKPLFWGQILFNESRSVGRLLQ